jgi:hypothetical protein
LFPRWTSPSRASSPLPYLLALITGCGSSSTDDGAPHGSTSATSSTSTDATTTSTTSGGAGGAGTGAYEDNFVQLDRWSKANGSPVNWSALTAELLDVKRLDSYVYVCTSTRGLVVVNPDPLRIAGQIDPLPYASRCQHLAKSGDLVAISNRSDAKSPTPFVSLLDLTDLAAPVTVSTYVSPSDSPEDVAFLTPDLLAVAMHGGGLALMALDGSGQLAVQKTLGGFTNAWDLALDQGRLYVADDTGGVAIVDVSTPSAPVLLSHVALGGSVKHVTIGDGMLFASAGSSGIHVLSLADPDHPALLSTFDTPGSAVMSEYDNGHLYVADWNEVRIVDVGDGTAPKLLGTETVPSKTFTRVLALAALDDRAFVGEWSALYSYQLFPDKVAPDIALVTPTLLFPQTPAGGESALSLVVANEGPQPLRIESIQGTDELVPLVDSLVVPSGGKDYIEVRFRPATSGAVEADLVLTTDDPDETVVKVYASGNQPGLQVGDQLPSWSWLDLQSGQTITTSGLLGDVVVLSYFATF